MLWLYIYVLIPCFKFNCYFENFQTLKSKENSIMNPHVLIIQIQQLRFYLLALLTHFSFSLPPSILPFFLFFYFALILFPFGRNIETKSMTTVTCSFILQCGSLKQGHFQTKPCGHYHILQNWQQFFCYYLILGKYSVFLSLKNAFFLVWFVKLVTKLNSHVTSGFYFPEASLIWSSLSFPH